jgi:hypothetical protein
MNQNKKFLGLLRPEDGGATNLRNVCTFQSTRHNTPQDSKTRRVWCSLLLEGLGERLPDVNSGYSLQDRRWHWGAFVQPLLQWKSKKYYILRVCVFSLRYPACNANAPHCNLLPARIYIIFQHYLTNGTIFEKSLNMKCVLIFSTTFVCNISHSKNN